MYSKPAPKNRQKTDKNPRKIDRKSTTKRTENRPQNGQKILMPASLKSIYRERQRTDDGPMTGP
jgi:hypothetical protein